MTGGPRYTDVVAALPATVPFVAPEAQERVRGTVFAARLGANENVFGPSPRAIRAMEAAAPNAWMYGDPEAHALRAALARHHAIDPASIVVGEGIDGLLGTLARLIVAPGTPVVTSRGAYPTFSYHVRAQGGALHEVPYRDDHEDPTALAEAAQATGAALVYLANPDNPMGTWHRAAQVQGLIDTLPEGCLLVLDEAYVDFAPAGAAPLFDTADTQVIRLRTFSKAHGLAGLRVGYAVAEPGLIRAFDKLRNHFGVGRLAQTAAKAALEDTEWLTHVISAVSRSRTGIAAIAAVHGLTALPSAANFVALDCGSAERAKAIMAGLLERGIFVRMPGTAPLDRCIRVSAGTDADLECLDVALADILTA